MGKKHGQGTFIFLLLIQASINGATDRCILVIGSTIKYQAKDYILGQMEESMTVSG